MTHPPYYKVILAITFFTAGSLHATDFGMEVKERIKSMELCIDSKYDSRVKEELKVYLRLSHRNTEKILERMVQYFPIIEPILRRHGLPDDLKYMVLVESEIDPYAESGDGAVGLWQIMPETARSLGLRVDDYIDERRDPIKSTEAASTHLSYLYSRLENWQLSIAAYNGGLARILRAKRKYGNTFALIKNSLPKETAEFPSSYVAAAYLCHFYDKHFFTTPKINPDIQIIDQIKIFKRTDFIEISKKTGLPVHVVYQLNPMYKKGYIPLNVQGLSLTIPKRLALKWDKLKADDYTKTDIIFYNPGNYYKTIVLEAEKNQSIYMIARQAEVSPYLLKSWNHIQDGIISEDQSLMIISPKKEPAQLQQSAGL